MIIETLTFLSLVGGGKYEAFCVGQIYVMGAVIPLRLGERLRTHKVGPKLVIEKKTMLKKKSLCLLLSASQEATSLCPSDTPATQKRKKNYQNLI